MRRLEEQWLRRTARSGFLLVALLVSIAFAVSSCGGGGSAPPAAQEGKGFPGDTEFSDDTIRTYYVDNNLVDPPAPPSAVLPAIASNEGELTQNVPNQGAVGSCATVSFAQVVYGFDVAAHTATRLLASVQFSYLFARYFQNNGQGGVDGWPRDQGSWPFTNYKALTTATYRNTYANGFLPADGPEGTVIHPTGVFFGFEGSPNFADPINKSETGGPTVDLDSYWNKIDLFQNLDTGPTQMAMTIRRLAFSPTSLDVKYESPRGT